MKVVILDAYEANPGDLSWDWLDNYFDEVVIHQASEQDQVVERAKDDLTKEIAPISAYSWNMNCYNVWHSFYELTSKHKKRIDIEFSYNMFLNNIIKAHFANNQIPYLPVHKTERILSDSAYRERYNLKKLPEKEFTDKLLACFTAKEYNEKYVCAKELYNYYMGVNPDFDINNFFVIICT